MGNLISMIYILLFVLLPIIVLVVGIIFAMSPPQNINSIVGYRTSTSTKNNDTWVFAQKYSAKALLAIGVITLALGLIVGIFLPTNVISVGVTLLVQIVLLILVIPLTENALKKNFDNAGNRKRQSQ